MMIVEVTNTNKLTDKLIKRTLLSEYLTQLVMGKG